MQRYGKKKKKFSLNFVVNQKTRTLSETSGTESETCQTFGG